jgi:hypothetical protein
VNRKWFDKGIVAGVLFILLFCGVAFAQEKSVIKMQGIVDKVYVAKKMMRVNEELTFVWDDKTIFRNEKGSPITIDRFKRDVWVYIEGVQAQKNGPILIKKIYTIPKLIREKEKHLYPFMESFSTSIGRL